MKKEDLEEKLKSYGDAVITYRSVNSNKLKYNVCTLDFDNEHIQSKNNRSAGDPSSLLMFCWDCDSYRLMKPETVRSVVPLSKILKND